jgi:hypothetical protein
MCHLQSLKLVIITAFVALSVSACATSRSVIPVAAPVSEQPKSNSFVKITEVRDLRQFSVNPGDPNMPSLGSADEIQDPTITSRALGRKRNGYGRALGDVVLPETTSVAELVRSSAKKALQDKGYVVVDDRSPEYARAQTLTMDVEQFWAWIGMGFTELTFTFDSKVGMKGGGNILVTDPAMVQSQTVVKSIAGTESVWTRVIQTGVNDMAEQMKVHIKPAPGAPLVSQIDGLATPAEVPGS